MRQHSFYMDDDDWSRLRRHCFDEGISVTSFIEKAVLDALAPAKTKTFEKTMAETIPSVSPDKLVAKALELTVAKERTFTPVPKPVARKTTRRRT